MRDRIVIRNEDAGTAADALSFYGPAHRLALDTLSIALRGSAAVIVKRFYEAVRRRTESSRMLEHLTEPELAHLEAQQIRNLMWLASAELDESAHRETARRIGRIHATLGLDQEEVVRSQALFMDAVYRSVDRRQYAEALAVLSQRFARELAIQTEVYQEVQSARSDLVVSIVRITSEVSSYAELVDGVVNAMGQLDEVVGCAAGRPDAEGNFRWEAVAGEGLRKLIQEIEGIYAGLFATGDAARHASVATTAWRTGEIQHAINVATNEQVAPWREVFLRDGLRSFAAVPLRRIGAAPEAVLCLFSAFPGGFSGEDQQDFLSVVQTLIEFAMTRIANIEGGTSAVPFATRQRWSALLRSDGLQMHYQPILNLKAGGVTKVEALARLQDGERLLAPGIFLPTFSRDDYFVLFARGLDQALAQRNRWLRDGFDINISINLPPVGLGDARYFEATREALARHACEPGKLTLEVLETEEVQLTQSSLGVERFKALGVTLAQDDLGAGHSSLNRLRILPFDYIKIDKDIVRLGENDNSDILRFVYQLTRLAHSLGKTVVVEGVEDGQLVDALMVLDVDLVQGYGVARPMSASQCSEWMKANRTSFSAGTPVSALGNLARLLIWEETMYLGSEVQRAASSPDAHRADDVERSRAARQRDVAGLPFVTSSIVLDRMLPSAVDLPARRALLDAAEFHGVRSNAYGEARQCLIAEIESLARGQHRRLEHVAFKN